MKINSIRTPKIIFDTKLEDLIFENVDSFKDEMILCITSKIISISEGRVIAIGEADKQELIRQEADKFLDHQNKYGAVLTIKNDILIPTSGIDESNGNGKYILWPSNPQETANKIRRLIAQKYNLNKVGVIITDSRTTPLRWGTTGVAIAYSGFRPLNNYIGANDLFGRKLMASKANVADGLAAAAVLCMGEGAEQTPIAIISEIPFVEFVKENPSHQELAGLRISIEDDMYGELLTSVDWKQN